MEDEFYGIETPPESREMMEGYGERARQLSPDGDAGDNGAGGGFMDGFRRLGGGTACSIFALCHASAGAVARMADACLLNYEWGWRLLGLQPASAWALQRVPLQEALADRSVLDADDLLEPWLVAPKPLAPSVAAASPGAGEGPREGAVPRATAEPAAASNAGEHGHSRFLSARVEVFQDLTKTEQVPGPPGREQAEASRGAAQSLQRAVQGPVFGMQQGCTRFPFTVLASALVLQPLDATMAVPPQLQRLLQSRLKPPSQDNSSEGPEDQGGQARHGGGQPLQALASKAVERMWEVTVEIDWATMLGKATGAAAGQDAEATVSLVVNSFRLPEALTRA